MEKDTYRRSERTVPATADDYAFEDAPSEIYKIKHKNRVCLAGELGYIDAHRHTDVDSHATPVADTLERAVAGVGRLHAPPDSSAAAEPPDAPTPEAADRTATPEPTKTLQATATDSSSSTSPPNYYSQYRFMDAFAGVPRCDEERRAGEVRTARGVTSGLDSLP